MLESLRIEAPPRVMNPVPIFPVRNFGEGLRTLAQLPELQVDMGPSSNQVTFQSPFPASLKCLLRKFPDYDSNERVIWKELPLHSVQKLIVNRAFEPKDQELEWFRGLLRDLKCLEQIEMGGKYGSMLRWLCGGMAQERIHPHIKTMTVR